MCNVYYCENPLPFGFAFHAGCSIFGDEVMGIHSRHGDHCSSLETGNDARDFSVFGFGAKCYDGLAAFGIEGPSDKIKLSSGAAEF